MIPLLFVIILLLPLISVAQTSHNPPSPASNRTAQYETDRLRRSLEALREHTLLLPVLPLNAPLPSNAPRFTTRAACVAALGFATVGAEQRLVCRALIDPFPFKGADPTPARLPVFPNPPFANRG